jgi:hypothetical protein
MNAPPLGDVVWKAPGVVGKPLNSAVPVTYALPWESTAIPLAPSLLKDPNRVEYERTGSMIRALPESKRSSLNLRSP